MACISASDPRFGEPGKSSRPMRGACWLAFLLSSGLIVVAARGDLWLDELMSLSFARNAHSIADIFVRFPYDNNHPLNTLFLYFAGVRQALFIYRSLAVLSGIGSVFLVGHIAGRHWGSREALASIVLTGTSYPLLLLLLRSARLCAGDLLRVGRLRPPAAESAARSSGQNGPVLGRLDPGGALPCDVHHGDPGVCHRQPGSGDPRGRILGRNRSGSRPTMVPRWCSLPGWYASS